MNRPVIKVRAEVGPGKPELLQGRWAARGGRLVRGLSWFYFAFIAGLWVFLIVISDRWWAGAPVIYGPRWIWQLPLLVLLPAAAVLRRRLLPLLLATAVLVVVPVMGFCIPWRQVLPEGAPGFRCRVLTCNVDGQNVNLDALRFLIAQEDPEVVALQEWPAEVEPPLFDPEARHIKKGNGLCLVSRFPIRHTTTLPEEHGWWDLVCRYDLQTPAGELHFFNLHLPTPREGLQAVVDRDRDMADLLKENLAMRARASEVAREMVRLADGMVLVAGDFNMPTDSAVYEGSWSDLRNAFSSAGLGFGRTKFTRWFGVRIDHILLGPGWRCRTCSVGPDVGSDHRPVVAELEWKPSE